VVKPEGTNYQAKLLVTKPFLKGIFLNWPIRWSNWEVGGIFYQRDTNLSDLANWRQPPYWI